MKRIVDGVTYNTATSTALARKEWKNDFESMSGTMTLYQTRGGAFFVHDDYVKFVWVERDGEQVEKSLHEFEPMNAAQAQKWMMEGEVEVFHNPFGDPPEATAEPEPAATLYVRAPATLKKRVDEAAREDKVSANVWAMRCVERCLRDAENRALQIDMMERVWGLASQFTAVDDKHFAVSTARTAFGQIQGLVEDLYERSGLGELKAFDKASAARHTSCDNGLSSTSDSSSRNRKKSARPA